MCLRIVNMSYTIVKGIEMVTVSIEFIEVQTNLGIIFILFILLCAICYSVFKYVQQFFCKHESYRETRRVNERDKGQL